MDITFKKKDALAASMKRKFTDHQVKGVNGCAYQQLLFFDVTVIKWNNFVDFNSVERNMVQNVTVKRKPPVTWILSWQKYFVPFQKVTVNQSQISHHLNIQTLAVTVKALNQCVLMPGRLGCVSWTMTEIICAYPAN